jgi:hypothetical protein
MLIRKLNVESVSDMMRNRATFLSPSVSSSSSSYAVISRSSLMSNGASLAPQETRIDFAVLPVTACQQLFGKFSIIFPLDSLYETLFEASA